MDYYYDFGYGDPGEFQIDYDALFSDIPQYDDTPIDYSDMFDPSPYLPSGEIINTASPTDPAFGWRYFPDGTAIDPKGRYYSNNPDTGQHEIVYDPTTPSSGTTSRVINSLLGAAKSQFTKKDASGKESLDWNKLTKAAAGVAGAYAGTQARENVQRVGYQGGIPQYTANRQVVQGTFDPNRRPGSSGQRYMTDVVFAGPGAGAVDAARAANQQQAAALQQANQANPAKERAMAAGGLASSDAAARYLRGETDGMADEIPSSIDGEQPAALSHGEFVIPADVVSHLGNGNSDAGAKKLYKMMDKIRVARTGSKEQGKQIDAESFMPGGLASAYAAGGSVQKYQTGGEVRPTFESNLSNWAGPYVTETLGRGAALAETPYQSYGGPLTAGASNLQQQAFQQAGQLQVPSSIGQAANTAGNIAGQMQGINYQPTQAGNQFKAPTAFQPSQFQSQYQAPQSFQTGQFSSDNFGAEQAQQYMNPYLQSSLDPQLDEARRQAEITRNANASRLTRAGAFGGSRQAVMDAENQRALGANMANITGQGYNTAYQNAMAQFNADQARRMTAQQAGEQSRQFGANQAANSAQMAAQFGLQGQQAGEQSRQFGATQGLNSAQIAAQFGLQGQQLGEQSRQFGASLGLQGLQGALSAAQAQGALGTQQGTLGLQNLAQLGLMGQTQRGIESEGIAADLAQFQEERDYPYKMLQFRQSLLQGLPLQTQGSTLPGTNSLQDAAGGAAAVIDNLKKLGVIT